MCRHMSVGTTALAYHICFDFLWKASKEMELGDCKKQAHAPIPKYPSPSTHPQNPAPTTQIQGFTYILTHLILITILLSVWDSINNCLIKKWLNLPLHPPLSISNQPANRFYPLIIWVCSWPSTHVAHLSSSSLLPSGLEGTYKVLLTGPLLPLIYSPHRAKGDLKTK